MKRSFLSLWGVLLASGLSCHAATDKPEAAKGAANQADTTAKSTSKAATVNGQTVLRDEVLSQLDLLSKEAAKGGRELTAEQKGQAYTILLEDLIYGEVIQQEADKSGVRKLSTFQEDLKRYEKALAVRYFMKDLQERARKEISPQALATVANQLKETENQVVICQLTVADQATAKRIERLVAAISSLDERTKKLLELAREYNLDKSGEITFGPMPESILGQLLKDLKDLKNLKAGGMIITPLENSSKVRIIYLSKREKLKEPRFLQEMAKKKALSDKTEQMLKEIIERAKIERFDMEGKPMNAPALKR